MRGFNFRPTDPTASFGLAQIKDLKSRKESFIDLWSKYKSILNDYPFINLTPVEIDKGELPLYVEVISPQRDLIVSELKKVGIETRKVYPDLDTATYLKSSCIINSLTNSRIFGRESFVLPSDPTEMKKNLNLYQNLLRKFLTK